METAKADRRPYFISRVFATAAGAWFRSEHWQQMSGRSRPGSIGVFFDQADQNIENNPMHSSRQSGINDLDAGDPRCGQRRRQTAI